MTKESIITCDKCNKRIYDYEFRIVVSNEDKIPPGTYHKTCYTSLILENHPETIDVILHKYEYYKYDKDHTSYNYYLCDKGTVKEGDTIITPDNGLVPVKRIMSVDEYFKQNIGGINGWILGVYTNECMGRPAILNKQNRGINK